MPCLYGVWDGRPFDNRQGAVASEVADLPDFAALNQFNDDNEIEAFVSHRGFLVFSPDIDLSQVFLRYWQTAKENSCGKCTPCRNGTAVIESLLKKAVANELDEAGWEELHSLAKMMRDSSFCGLGQTTPHSILAALEFFKKDLSDHRFKHAPIDFYSVVTAPCIEACPALVNVPRYIDYLKEGRPDLSTGVLLKHYPLVGSCGRVCVHFCEKACRRVKLEAPVDIKNLKRFAADTLGCSMDTVFRGVSSKIKRRAEKIAIIGAGGAGITCAYHLLLKGYQVDIYESKDRAGGMALTGIPPYRLPKELLAQETTKVVENLGGRLMFGRELGVDFTIDDLFEDGYNAVFLGIGCAQGTMLGLEEDKKNFSGYTNGIQFLREVEDAVATSKKINYEGDTVIVGCGNVAMDCCRTAVRISTGKVSVVYRRTEASSPADPVELHEAHEEGVHFNWLTAQKRLVVQEGKVVGLECIKLRVDGDPNDRKSKLIEIPGSEFVIPCTKVIAAIGQRLDTDTFSEEDGIELGKRNSVVYVGDDLQTSRPGVFAGGDCVKGPRSLIEAMAQGEKAADAIEHYLNNSEIAYFNSRERMSSMISEMKLFNDKEQCRSELPSHRSVIAELLPVNRTNNFDEVELGFTPEQAAQEADRCMRCYRIVSVATARQIPDQK